MDTEASPTACSTACRCKFRQRLRGRLLSSASSTRPHVYSTATRHTSQPSTPTLIITSPSFRRLFARGGSRILKKGRAD